jgi:hypothetical protein
MKNCRKVTGSKRPLVILFRISVLVLALMINGQVQAQNVKHMPEIENPFQQGFPEARFEGSKKIVLDINAPLSEFYVAEVSGLKISNDDEVLALLNKIITDNLCQFMFDLNARKILIHLDTRNSKPEWSVSQWNDYLNSMLNK